MPSPIVVFDLDGTLADTAGDLIKTLNIILDEQGLQQVPLDQARGLIGAGARALIARGFALDGQILEPQRTEELFQRFLTIYEDHLADTTELFPGVITALDQLERHGFSFAVCTNKIERHSVMLLDKLGIRTRFAAICGRDTFAFYKPDPRHLIETITVSDGDIQRAIMIGDSRTDIDTAKAADVPVIAVPFGYTDVPVAKLGPDLVIEHFDQLVDGIGRLGFI